MKKRIKKLEDFAKKVKNKVNCNLYSKIVDDVVKDYVNQITIKQN